MNIPICLDGLSWLIEPWAKDMRRKARNMRKRQRRMGARK